MKRLAIAVTAAAVALKLSAAVDHAAIAFGAFNAMVDPASTAGAVISPFSFEIDCAVFAEASEPIVKAHYSETMGALNGFEGEFSPIAHEFAEPGTNGLDVVSARMFIASDPRMIAPAYRDRMQQLFRTVFCSAWPKAGAERWLRAVMDGRMEEFSFEDEIARSSDFSFFDAVSVAFAWSEPFPAAGTAERPFFAADGRRVNIPFLQDTRLVSLRRSRDSLSLALPLTGGAVFYAVMPAEGASFADWRRSLRDARLERLTGWYRSLTETGVSRASATISLPKFSLSSSFSMEPAFARSRFPVRDLVGFPAGISAKVLRQCVNFTLDERGPGGCPAAGKPSVTAEGCPRAVFNRPFVFFIHHEPTGIFLALGQFTGVKQ